MKVSEYIEKLQALRVDHGDLECVDTRDNPMPNPEFNDDVEPCFVLAEDG